MASSSRNYLAMVYMGGIIVPLLMTVLLVLIISPLSGVLPLHAQAKRQDQCVCKKSSELPGNDQIEEQLQPVINKKGHLPM